MKDQYVYKKGKMLVGIFETENEARKVIIRLKEIGYTEADITVMAKDKDALKRLDSDSHPVGTGATIGGTLGGLAAALPALGVFAIPGIGPILAAGPIAVIIGGIVAGGLVGGLVGALVEVGFTEEEAKDYEKQIEQGKIIVFVEDKETMREDVYIAYKQYNSIINRDRIPPLM